MWMALMPFSHEMDAVLPPDNATPDRRAEALRFLDCLSVHFARITPKNRTALVLSLVEGYTVPEIAHVLGCSVNATRKRLYRARQALVSRVQKDPYCRHALKELIG